MKGEGAGEMNNLCHHTVQNCRVGGASFSLPNSPYIRKQYIYFCGLGEGGELMATKYFTSVETNFDGVKICS